MDTVQQFLQLTNTSDPIVAQQYLEKSGGDVELAMALYLSSNQKPQQIYKSSTPASKLNGGVMSFSQLLQDNDDEDDKRQGFFAGGSHESGIQIKGPKKDDEDELVGQIFEKARSNQARPKEQNEETIQFSGSGYRLGDTNYGKTQPAVTQKKKEAQKKVIEFYKNGFVVEGVGVLRSYTDPVDRQFLKDLNEGYIPKEFEHEAQGRGFNLQMVDRKSEEYKEPPKSAVCYAGSGYSLGGSKTSNKPVKIPKSLNFNPDESKSIIQIQVRFHDGTKKIARFNPDQTLLHLRAWIESVSPCSSTYDLISGFPPKPLTNFNITIQEAGIAGSVVSQKCH